MKNYLEKGYNVVVLFYMGSYLFTQEHLPDRSIFKGRRV